MSLPAPFLLYLFSLAPLLHWNPIESEYWAVLRGTGVLMSDFSTDPCSWPFFPILISPLTWILMNYLCLSSGLWFLLVCSSTCHVFAPAFWLYILATSLCCYWNLVLEHMPKVLWKNADPQNANSFYANSALIVLKLLRGLSCLSKQNTFSEGT